MRINKYRQYFIVKVLTLFLAIKGKINFYQLQRYGKYSEQRYRQQFGKRFNFMAYNIELVKKHGGGEYILAIDPSFISKVGKHTPGLGYFWSGQVGAVKRGLEIVGLAAIDVSKHTAFHIEALQTLTCGSDFTGLTRYSTPP